MTDSLLIAFIIFIACFVCSAFFSASEAAFLSISRAKVRTLLGDEKNGESSSDFLKGDPDRFLMVLFIGTTFSTIAAASLGTGLAIHYFGVENMFFSIISSVLFVTAIMLIVGEIIPKAYASRNAEKLTLTVSPFLHFLSQILSPLIWVCTWIVRFVSGDRPFAASMITEEDIKEWIHAGTEEGTIEEQQQQMLYSVLEFGDTSVRKVMTRRQDVVMLEDTATASEALHIFQDTRFSRLPVYHDTADKIIGILNIKDLFAADFIHQHHAPISSLTSEPFFVPDSKKIDELLREMQKKKTHMAIVLDEYGSFEGVITVEDILEELVGDILDEYDTEEAEFVKISDDKYSVDASCLIEDINEELGISIPMSEEYETIAGFMMTHLGHIPSIGEEVTIAESGEKITVTYMNANRITRVRFELVSKERA
ncbi:MAG: hemolysin family protein [Methanomicrobiales archaeon]|jgi:CBS domain containing-hemolysin-like protein|nr:hemolysin family protein [Methanomicrobiales archaeon]